MIAPPAAEEPPSAGSVGAPEESGRGTGGGARAPGQQVPRPVLVLTAAALAAAALAAGRLHGNVWGGILLLVAAAAFGFATGLAYPAHRQASAHPVAGRAGALLLFGGAVLFTAAQAYAVGRAVAEGGPLAGAVLLALPAGIALFALRKAGA